MEDAPLPSIAKEEILETFDIKQEENNYKLIIKIINQEIIMNLIVEKEFKKEYEIKLSLEEIKKLHKIFSFLGSSLEFVEYIKALIDNKKLVIKPQVENKIKIELTVEYLLKQNIIEFDLIQKKINYELIIEDLCKNISAINKNFDNLENKYNKILEENKIIKEENKNIKEKLKILENVIAKIDVNELNKKENINEIKNSINSSIMEKDEFDIIYPEIKERLNKEIKEIKKLYQAKSDGGKTEIFHQKCDNIKNTLIFYKSTGKRRFGAFASKVWKSKGESKLDKNCFLFSLDKKKIYLPKNDNYYKLSRNTFDGPSFFLKNKYDIYCISLQIDAFQARALKTYEKKFEEIFEGDGNALSEDGNALGINLEDYEVFQIII